MRELVDAARARLCRPTGRDGRRGRALILLLACFAVLAAACTSGPTGQPPTSTTTGSGPIAQIPTATPWPTLTPTALATATLPRPTATTGPSPTRTPLDDTLDGILAKTVGIRGLSNREPVRTTFIPRDQVRDYLIKALDEEDARAEIEEEKGLYVLFDLLQPTDDLYELYISLMTEQVLGFYEFDSKEMRVVGSGEELATLDELTLSHEYVHALQDQNFGVGDYMTRISDRGEQSLAMQALSEGDATLSMALYAREYKSVAEIAQVQQQAAGVDTEKLESAPEVVQVNALFPYLQGAAFVAALVQDGGWAAVDRAFRSPPTTTEQVLHPRKYIAGERPEQVTMPNLNAALGSDWTVLGSDTVGELGWLQYLGTALDASRAGRAAAGWGGDQYVLLRDSDGKYALAALTVWDSAADAAEFEAGLKDLWSGKKRGQVTVDGNAVAWSGGKTAGRAALRDLYVLVVLGPDTATLARIARLFPAFQ